MKPWIWLRGLAVLLALFAVGHTLGTAAPHVTRGPQEAAVFEAMQGFSFRVMGFTRTHWEFYRGFALIISVQLLLMATIAWQLSAVSRRDPRRALPMAITLQLGCVGLLVFGWMFFFAAPILMSIMAVLGSTVIVVLLARNSRAQEAHGDSRLARASAS
jgi:hypothetical protein